jgi:hypothetical protein
MEAFSSSLERIEGHVANIARDVAQTREGQHKANNFLTALSDVCGELSAATSALTGLVSDLRKEVETFRKHTIGDSDRLGARVRTLEQELR